MNGINYYDEDFCKDDLDEVDGLDELECMEQDLYCEIDNSKERIEIYNANIKIIQKKIKETEK